MASHIVGSSPLPKQLKAEKFEECSVPVGIFYFAPWGEETALLYNRQHRASCVETVKVQGIILGEQAEPGASQRTGLANRSTIERPVLISESSIPETYRMLVPEYMNIQKLPCIGVREDEWMRYAAREGSLEVGTKFLVLEKSIEFDRRKFSEHENLPSMEQLSEQYTQSLLIFDERNKELFVFTLKEEEGKSLSIPLLVP